MTWLKPRHALKEAPLPPVPKQGLIAAYFTCHCFNSSPALEAAEPPIVRDAASATSRGPEAIA
ncbi:hypothetical protein [Laspinema olomoucense]|uniref:Uncharacterized protein n=1 Tax=Laspinema olomoucense D3b TaxID=2953688 RepID=A0ABT2NE93_9CYAN|nr:MULTISPECIES: hypothetical protein [unclassified Laspinema]MCT7972542.1 hypothetical protein [Laspinema sp. D3d]MCT7981026.1 hypothetical protein [Laspinema sp. D3b]MCT7988700.1 hypothetical protein [Laspinema sp. D3a]MCT7992726.1 hypothetical protein [Laspinema sp. D3c]